MPNSTIKIAFRSPMSLTIFEPLKEGDNRIPKSAVINGNATAIGSTEGITEVDAGLYHAWLKANPENPAVVAGLLREVDPKEDEMSQFGWEQGIDAVSKENAKLASQGSLVKEPGPVSSTDMKATSDTPADDSPRSQTKFSDGPVAGQPNPVLAPNQPAGPFGGPGAQPQPEPKK